MTRVSENSSQHSINYSVGKTKSRLEDLQIKGSNLKRIQKPSDDPIGNIELLSIRSQQVDANQYLRNSNYAKTLLEFTENSLNDLTDIVGKAKEIAIGQASDFYNPEVRESVAKEVHQLRLQALSVANRRLGNRYIFSGYKTLTKPFDSDGNYKGDKGKITLEVAKDYFVPINLNGNELFFHSNDSSLKNTTKFKEKQNFVEPNQEQDIGPSRGLASVNEAPSQQEQITSIFDDLSTLENALLTNNPDVVQNLMDSLDDNYDRIITKRTEIGALSNSIANAENAIENKKLLNASYKSKIEDADLAELFTELNKQQNVLKATYKASANLLNQSLLDFVR